MSCEEIVDHLDPIYDISGKGAIEKRKDVLLKIFKHAQSPRELKYIIRIVQGKLKIGVMSKSIMTVVNSLPNQSTISEQILGKQMLSRDISFGKFQ
jgi:ATP-dependent DNA ligase